MGFHKRSCGGAGAVPGSSAFFQVPTFGDLPPANEHPNEIYFVEQPSGGILGLFQNPKGFYFSDGTTWMFAGDDLEFATQVIYDNTTSGLSSDFVQGALDEIVTALGLEINARIAQDAILQGQIDTNDTDILNLQNEQATQNTAIGQNTANITQEIIDRTNADNALQAQITSNDTDITNLQNEQVTQNANIAANVAAITAVQTNLTTHENDFTNPHNVTAAQVGLGNVDNTSDADKPVSTAQQAALDLKVNLADMATLVPANETDTTFTLQPGNILRYVGEDGTNQDVDLSPIVDTNLARIITASINGANILTLTRDDSSTVTVDLSQLDQSALAAANAAAIAALATVASSGDYNDLINLPTLGTAAAADTTDFATAAQGALADSATQPGDNVSTLANDAGYITAGDVAANETDTTIQLIGNTLRYIGEDGTNQDIDLSLYLDDTNLARLVSGTVDGAGIATFTRDDSSTFTVDFSSLFDDTNLARIVSGNVSGTDLILNRNDATTITIDMSAFDQTAAVNANTLAINTNTSDIATNASDIASNDTDISDLQSEQTTQDTAIAANATSIAQEITDRTNADTALQTQITSNDTDITALQARLDIRETVYEVYEAGTTGSATTPVIVDMDTERFAVAGFSLAAGRVTVSNAGRYKINYSVSANSTNNTRASVLVDLYRNASIEPGTRSFSYHRTTASGEDTATKTVFLDLSAGDIIDVRFDVIAGTGGAHPTIANSSNLTFERIT